MATAVTFRPLFGYCAAAVVMGACAPGPASQDGGSVSDAGPPVVSLGAVGSFDYPEGIPTGLMHLWGGGLDQPISVTVGGLPATILAPFSGRTAATERGDGVIIQLPDGLAEGYHEVVVARASDGQSSSRKSGFREQGFYYWAWSKVLTYVTTSCSGPFLDGMVAFRTCVSVSPDFIAITAFRFLRDAAAPEVATWYRFLDGPGAWGHLSLTAMDGPPDDPATVAFFIMDLEDRIQISAGHPTTWGPRTVDIVEVGEASGLMAGADVWHSPTETLLVLATDLGLQAARWSRTTMQLGSFTTVQISPDARVYTLVARDLNADGIDELIASPPWGAGVGVMIMEGNPTDGFRQVASSVLGGDALSQLRSSIADLDQDGRPDIIHARGHEGVDVFFNDWPDFDLRRGLIRPATPIDAATGVLLGDPPVPYIITNNCEWPFACLYRVVGRSLAVEERWRSEAWAASGDLMPSDSWDVDGDGLPDLLSGDGVVRISLWRHPFADEARGLVGARNLKVTVLDPPK